MTRRIEELLAERKRRREAVRYVPHAPTERQRIFLALNCREALFGGAAGGGKSDALLMDALSQVDKPGYAALLFRLTLTDLKLPGALIDRAEEWLRPTNAHWDGMKSQWRFPVGAKLQFGYVGRTASEMSKKPTRYKSSEFQFIGFDEQTQFNETQFRWMFNRLRRPRGSDITVKVRGATNPGDIGHHWVMNRYNLPERPNMAAIHTGPRGRVFVPSRLTDNPHIDQEGYQESLSELDEVTRAQLERGEWVVDASMLVYKYDKRRNLVQKLPEQAGEATYILSIDYGNVDATAFAVGAFYPHDPNLYVVFSEKHEALTPSDAAEKVEELQEMFGEFEAIVGDVGGLGKGYAEEARKHWAIPIHPAEKADKLGNIKLLNGDFEHGRVQILEPYCQPLIDELGSLLWKDESKLAEHPVCENHAADAMLYLWRKSRHWLATAKRVKHKRGTVADYQEQAERRKEARRQAVQRRTLADWRTQGSRY